MTRLRALVEAGLLEGASIDDDVNMLDASFGCPPDTDCPDGFHCHECWCTWLAAETNLEVKLQ